MPSSFGRAASPRRAGRLCLCHTIGMQVTENATELKLTAVRAEHAGVLAFAICTLLFVTYASGELTRWASATYQIDEGVLPLMIIIYLLLPLLVNRLQPTRFSPLFRLTVMPAVAVIQAAFAIYRQSSIVFNGDEIRFDRESGKIEQNGDFIADIAKVELVELYRNTFPTIGDTFNIKLLMEDGARHDIGFAVRSGREARRIADRLSRFLDVPLVDLGDGRDRAETIGSRYRHPERYDGLGEIEEDGTDPTLDISAADFEDPPEANPEPTNPPSLDR